MSNADLISIQLYSLRSLGDADRILDIVAEAGYSHVETLGSHLDDAKGTRARLDTRGLKASSGHVSLAALRERPDAIAEACKTVGFSLLLMPSVPPELRDSDAAFWRSLGKELGGMAERFQRHGIQLGYHNHHWELKPKEDGPSGSSRDALAILFEAAGGSPLAWEADVAWLVRGGADPKALLARYRDRLAAAHVKDIAPAGQNVDQDGWADVGSGVLDWKDLWQACRANGAKWMVVEHDKPADPARTARACYAYLSRLAA
jgi:sugar phosphate isomerase/epimerase